MSNHDDNTLTKTDSRKDVELIPKAPTAVERWFPFAHWIKNYSWNLNAPKDLIAAITIAALLVPEGMGYATIAGVPMQLGLYAAPLALLGYALFGGSRIMVFAVTGSVAAVTANVIGELGTGDASKVVVFAAALALTGGIILLTAGLLRLGWIVNFIPRSVMTGIIVGMSVNIIVGQFPKLVGIKVPDGNTLSDIWNTFKEISQWNVTALLLGAFGIAFIILLEKYFPKVPASLAMVVIASLMIAVFGLSIDIVPTIPPGVPMLSVPTGITASQWVTLFLGGLVLSLVCFSESWGSSSAVSRVTHDDIDINQEFRAYGISSIGASLLGGMPVSGSLSKSNTAIEARATSQMTNIFLAGIVILVLLFLSPAFKWLPEAALAAIVITAMRNSANPMQFLPLWKTEALYCSLGILTGFLVLIIGLMPAMVFGVIISLIYVIYRISFPTGAVLGKSLDNGYFAPLTFDYGRSFHRKSKFKVEAIEGVLIYRFSAPLIFANAQPFINRIKQHIIDLYATNKKIHSLVIDCESIVYMDITGIDAVHTVQEYCERYNISVYLARMHGTSLTMLASVERLKNLYDERNFHTIHEAVEQAKQDSGRFEDKKTT
ncbi:MAG: SulP family inorganic anion transporter [Pyrinomonadaceae bacterium]